MSSIIDGVGFDYFVKTPNRQYACDYNISWKNDGLASDKSILTRRFKEQVSWIINNGAEGEKEKAECLKTRF